jgi:hypothetical protein
VDAVQVGGDAQHAFHKGAQIPGPRTGISVAPVRANPVASWRSRLPSARSSRTTAHRSMPRERLCRGCGRETPFCSLQNRPGGWKRCGRGRTARRRSSAARWPKLPQHSLLSFVTQGNMTARLV